MRGVRDMKILIISYYFPPFNTIGAVRVGKMAKYLRAFGHDVRVVTAADQPLPKTLPLEIEEWRVSYTPWLNVNRVPELLLGGRGRIAAKGYAVEGDQTRLLPRLGKLYKNTFNFPDGQIGWLPYAKKAAGRVIEEWRPDIIYASALPYTSLIVGSALSKKFGLPWVAELRDLWVDHHNRDNSSSLRNKIEERLEHRVLSDSAQIVTVSEPWLEMLQRKYRKRTSIILNGFDLSDYQGIAQPSSGGPLHIVYTGSIYKRYQDVSPLFRALKELNAKPEHIKVSFIGRNLGNTGNLAQKHGVEDLVEVREPVSYMQALALQAQADILLFLLWNNKAETGVYTGKLFEYLGAQRPILAIGFDNNLAADLVGDCDASFVSDDSAKIALRIREWLTQKADEGFIPPRNDNVAARFSREEQARKLEQLLIECCGLYS